MNQQLFPNKKLNLKKESFYCISNVSLSWVVVYREDHYGIIYTFLYLKYAFFLKDIDKNNILSME